MEEDNKRKEKKTALWFLIALYVIIMVLPEVIYVESELFQFFEQVTLILLPTVVISIICIKKSQSSFKEFFSFKKISFKTILLLTLVVFALPVVVNCVIKVADMFIPYSTEVEEEFALTPQMGDSTFFRVLVFFYSLFFTAVFPGVCEEMLFRGSVLSLSKPIFKQTWIIVIVNALLFAVFHRSMDQLFYTFFLGLALTSVVIATGSIVAGMYVHIFYNSIVGLADLFDLSIHPVINGLSTIINETDSIPSLIIAVLIIVLVVWELNRDRVKKLENNHT